MSEIDHGDRRGVVGDVLKAIAQATPVTTVVAGLVDAVQARQARKQLR